MAKDTAIKWGIGLAMIGILGYTVNYLMTQIRLLINTDFEFVGTAINKLSFKQISITLWWKVVNKSDIAITVSNQNYDIFINGRFLKKVGYASPVEIKPHAETRIPTYIVFAPKDLGKIGLENVGNFFTSEGRKKLKLTVRGTMTVKTSVFELKEFPFEYEDTIENIYNY